VTWFGTLLVAVAAGLVASNGGRAQLLIAQLAKELGRSQGLLLSALITSTVTIILAAWLGSLAGSYFDQPNRTMLAAAAMTGASVRLLWPIRTGELKEPTRSLGAISLVLLVRQMADAPRLFIFAAATQLEFTLLLGLGGTAGAGLCHWFSWRHGDIIDRRFSAPAVRWTLGLMLLVAGGLLAADAANLVAWD
jgi:putative Ca2+/H+ antiporter (TMEM165/GDT1 family)